MTPESCPCRHTRDKHGRENIWLCPAHQREHDAYHAAAVESCSHAVRDRNLDLVGGEAHEAS